MLLLSSLAARLPRSLQLAASVIASSAAVLTVAAPAADAALPWAGCAPTGFQCAQLGVPLDHANAAAGGLTLSITRKAAPTNPLRTAVVVLAGGPGQAALPFAPDFAKQFASGLADKDLIVFDQRGTGKSGQLNCPALRRSRGTLIEIVQACSLELGPRRAFYTTAQSVEDLESIRVAGGYDKLIVAGVSYGTKVALAYASAHPATSASLILDSVVTPEGPDALQRSSLQAVSRAISTDLCAQNACAAATPDAVGDLQRLAAKLARRSISGGVYSGSGRRFTATLGVNGLVNVLLAGDFNPALRSELPGAVRSALKGDQQPILRLSANSAGLENFGSRVPGARLQTADAGDDALYLATICEENATFPWTRGAPVTQRAQEIAAAVNGQPAGAFGIFPAIVGLSGFGKTCLGWSVASGAPAAPAPLPNIPVLILDGQEDLRTPIEDAQSVAARLPQAQFVPIPHTGHSVLTGDLTACSQTALNTFLTGGVATQCTPSATIFAPGGRAPRSLSAVPKARNLPSKAGRTLNALAASLNDARLHVIGEAIATGGLPKAIGGLRGGSLRVKTQKVWQLRSYEFVPGVRISGTYRSGGTSSFTFSGSSAARGAIRVSKSGRATGRLDGRRVNATRQASGASATTALPSIAKALSIGRRQVS